MLAKVRRRYLDLLASIYLYNEHRGYTALDRVLDGARARAPDDLQFLAAIEKHRADERKHYLMFRRWFERRGVMPYAVDRTCGHIDRFIEIMFRRKIDALDTRAVAASDALFARLCRVISLTEQRGYRQLGLLLRNGFVLSDRRLVKIFQIIEQDEPSHWAPYEQWLSRHAVRAPNRRERLVDTFIHSELLFLKLPLLFLRFGLARRRAWPDEVEIAPAMTPAAPRSRDRLPGWTARLAAAAPIICFYAALAVMLEA